MLSRTAHVWTIIMTPDTVIYNKGKCLRLKKKLCDVVGCIIKPLVLDLDLLLSKFQLHIIIAVSHSKDKANSRE